MNAPIHALSLQREAEKRMSLRTYMAGAKAIEHAECPECGISFEPSDLPEDSDLCCPAGCRAGGR